jgi:hypothetical protein
MDLQSAKRGVLRCRYMPRRPLICGDGFIACHQISACSARFDAPIPIKKSSGGEPLAVIVGQGVLRWCPRSSRETVISGTPNWVATVARVMFLACRAAQVTVVVDWGGLSQQSEYFAGDGSFVQPQNLLFGAAVSVLTLDVVAGLLVGRHAHQRDAVQGIVGCPVAAAGESVAGDFARGRRYGLPGERCRSKGPTLSKRVIAVRAAPGR